MMETNDMPSERGISQRRVIGVCHVTVTADPLGRVHAAGRLVMTLDVDFAEATTRHVLGPDAACSELRRWTTAMCSSTASPASSAGTPEPADSAARRRARLPGQPARPDNRPGSRRRTRHPSPPLSCRHHHVPPDKDRPFRPRRTRRHCRLLPPRARCPTDATWGVLPRQRPVRCPARTAADQDVGASRGQPRNWSLTTCSRR